ncbi:MAG TPA: OmpA family protein [Polyangiales bacterium]|nr:OmpA family protein [Polyangiales bacterium]
MALLLGLGGVDLAVLNVLIMPTLLTATDLSPSRRAPDIARAPVAAPAPTLQPLAANTVAHGDREIAPTPGQVAPAPQPMAAEEPVRILFGIGNWWISPSGRRALSESLDTLKQSKGAIEVIGHADSLGTRLFNQHLSEQRAQAVAMLLTSEGVEPTRLHVRGVGEDEPSQDGRDRRVEVRIGGAR